MVDDRRVTKLQELLYELTVSEVMKRDVITVPAQTKMSKVREILRSGNISGAPVVEDESLVGMISINDFIDWLSEGGPECSVADRMTSEVKTLYVGESLVQAVEKFDRYGFGRFPVIDEEGKEILGIITKGTIVQGLLKRLAVASREEEERLWTCSIFDDIVADRASLVLHYSVVAKDFHRAGECASGLKKTLKVLNVHPRVIRRAAVATYEAEMNIVIYSEGGEITVRIEPHLICIKASDHGPGIPDIERAMQPGFSTATEWIREMGFGAGMGLSNIRKCADDMSLTSIIDDGTRLKITIEM